MFAIAVLEKALIVVSGSAEEMMSCNQAFMFQKFIHLHFILGRIPASNWPPTLKNRWLPESLHHRRHSTLAL
jgi:hypothetical protein